MTEDLLKSTESKILKLMNDMMLNESIRPEAEYQLFSRYLASFSNSYLKSDPEILHLINSHGVELRNDVKYWIDKGKSEGLFEEVKKQVPVLNPEHFNFKDFSDVIEKLKELPSEWTVIQITKKFSLADFTRKLEIPSMYLTRLACGNLANSIHPYSVSSEDNSNFQENIFKVLENLMEMRKQFYNLGRTSRKLSEAFYKTNSELENFVRELELYVLGPWICLFQGRLEDQKLENETRLKLKNLLNVFCSENRIPNLSNIAEDIIYQITLGAHALKNKFMLSILQFLFNSEGKNFKNSSQLMLLIENLKMLNLGNSCAVKRARRGPIILILDTEFEVVPWEMITILSGQPVCRISSLHLLYALYKYHESNIKNGFRIIEIDHTYCLVNPSQDLKECEKEMKDFLKERIPWAEIELGKAPDPKNLLSKIENYTAYLYCGHGSGTHYLKLKDLKRAFVKSLLLLFGCSSNVPKNCGGRTPPQNQTYTYISNGCPCVIGCILDVGSSDADAACKELLSNIMPVVPNKGAEKIYVPEPDVLRALTLGKQACPKYWSKSAFVARGIPCKTAVGNINVITAQNSS